MNEQNTFYTSISKYYSEIFPYNQMQLKFVQDCVGNIEKKQILDIGCATGELAFQLTENGAFVTGIDLNEDLLKQAVRRSGFQSAESKKCESEFASPNPKFQTGNMLELEQVFRKEQFDAVLCFGNTLVHLPTIGLISEMLNGVFTVLKPGGHFLIQILNYDYILEEQLSDLPLIETENIKFIRKYKFEKGVQTIRFQTDLQIKKEEKIVSNETSLLALKSKELIQLLSVVGFKNMEIFSNFKQDKFGGKHLPLVLSCRK